MASFWGYPALSRNLIMTFGLGSRKTRSSPCSELVFAALSSPEYGCESPSWEHGCNTGPHPPAAGGRRRTPGARGRPGSSGSSLRSGDRPSPMHSPGVARELAIRFVANDSSGLTAAGPLLCRQGSRRPGGRPVGESDCSVHEKRCGRRSTALATTSRLPLRRLRSRRASARTDEAIARARAAASARLRSCCWAGRRNSDALLPRQAPLSWAPRRCWLSMNHAARNDIGVPGSHTLLRRAGVSPDVLLPEDGATDVLV